MICIDGSEIDPCLVRKIMLPCYWMDTDVAAAATLSSSRGPMWARLADLRVSKDACLDSIGR